jgi:hypothetical protein
VPLCWRLSICLLAISSALTAGAHLATKKWLGKRPAITELLGSWKPHWQRSARPHAALTGAG